MDSDPTPRHVVIVSTLSLMSSPSEEHLNLLIEKCALPEQREELRRKVVELLSLKGMQLTK